MKARMPNARDYAFISAFSDYKFFFMSMRTKKSTLFPDGLRDLSLPGFGELSPPRYLSAEVHGENLRNVVRILHLFLFYIH
jgi:hypothetical protein